MAVEGTVAEVPAGTPASGATPDPKASPDAGVKPAASQPEYKWDEDARTKGMLADLKKEREARQTHERKLAEYENTTKEDRRRIAALAGITTPSKEQADTDAIRAKILELYPELAELGSISDMKKAIEDQQVQTYASHSSRMVDQIFKGIASEYGDLTERQKQRIFDLYVRENERSPEIHARHNQGDPKLIDEFVKGMIEDLVDPIKKKTQASETARFRPVPGGRDRSTPLKGEKPKTGEDMLRAHFRDKTRQG